MKDARDSTPWLLLFGGAAETGPLARAMSNTGCRVLVSTVTDEDLGIEDLPDVLRHVGPLDAPAMVALMQARGVQRVVIATHPYAVVVAENAIAAAQELDIPYIRYVRPPALDGTDEEAACGVIAVDSHAAAADAAFAVGGPVLLTTGSRHLASYVQASARTGLPVVARVLDRPESAQACREAGIPDDRVIAGKGPFGVDANLQHLRRYQIAALVTKDGGRAGGVGDKLEAARVAGCRVVLIRRPAVDEDTVRWDQEEVAAWCRRGIETPGVDQ